VPVSDRVPLPDRTAAAADAANYRGDSDDDDVNMLLSDASFLLLFRQFSLLQKRLLTFFWHNAVNFCCVVLKFLFTV